MLLKSLHDVMRAFVWWSLGLAGYCLLIVALWPTVRDNPALAKLEESYPKELRAFFSFGGFDITTAEGFLGTELYSLMVPLLLIVAAIGAGARAIAGEEERGTLDVLLANPISRTRLAVEKALALALELLGLALVVFVSLAAATSVAGADVAAGNLAAATASAFLLATALGCIAFALGAATGRRGLAIGLGAAVAVTGYLINGLAPLVDAIHALRWLSPWYHYAAGDPLRTGLSATHAAVLAGISVGAVAVALFGFRRRDVGVAR